MTSSPSQFKPIYADIWQHDVDDWERVQAKKCYRFKGGFVQLSNRGYWFPYQGNYTAESLFVNLVKPHVLV